MVAAMASRALTRHGLNWLRLAILVPLALLSFIGLSSAQEPAPAPKTLKVGVYVSPPFVMKDEKGYKGMAIDLWQMVEKTLGVASEFTEFDNFNDIIAAVAEKRVDVGVTNLSITEHRAKVVDFTHPWFDGGVRVMVHSDGGTSLGDIVGDLGDAGHLETYGWIAAAILIATMVLTLIDRSFDKDFSRRWGHGLAQSFYHVMSVATSGKANHKHLFGAVGTVFAALWMVCGVAVVAYVTSSITSVMTAAHLTQQINSVADLQGKLVGVRAGSTSEEYLKSIFVKTMNFNHMAEATSALVNDEISAIVGDSPVLEYYAHAHPDLPLSVVGNLFQPEKYGFAFTDGNPLTKAASVAILGAQETGELEKIRLNYFGTRP
jgi:polar amino acid transport system substrate-binding protein